MPTDDGIEFKHESYALVEFSRYQTTGQRLFGSAVKVSAGIALTIKRATRRYDLHRDWFHGREELIEVNMTELQFAQLLTNLNNGEGVPCTLNHLLGARVPEPPETDKSQAELVHADVRAKAVTLGKKLDGATAQIKAVMAASKSMSAKDKKALEDALAMFVQEVNSNLPFLMEAFQEAADEVVTQCKSEVVAFTERTLKAQGLEHVKAQAPKLEYGE